MIGRNDDRRGNHHPPIAIKREKGQRSENMKMCLDATATEMNQQCRHEHLANRDRVSGHYFARPSQREIDW